MAFCRRVMRNLAIDQWRRQRHQVALVEGYDGCDPRAADFVAAVEVRPLLLSALRTLSPHQREIVVLRYFDDRSENEVAELLGIAPGTVKSTLSRAVAKLRLHPAIRALFTAPAATPAEEVRYAGD